MDEQIIIMRKGQSATGGGFWYELANAEQAPSFGSMSSVRLEMDTYPTELVVSIRDAEDSEMGRI